MTVVQGYRRALYYPSMNVRDEGWLKSALLYWENIETIVPLDVAEPYQGYTQQACAEAGLLIARHVARMPEAIKSVSRSLIAADWNAIREYMTDHHFFGMDPRASDTLLHVEKMTYDLQAVLEREGLVGGRGGDGWIQANPYFADFYMSCLADEVAFRLGASSVTDQRKEFGFQLCKQMADRAIDNALQNAPSALVQIAFRKLKIDDDTPIAKILKFRQDHSEELARFRGAMRELAKRVEGLEPDRDLSATLDDIWETDVEPSLLELTDTLAAGGIGARIEGVIRMIGAVAVGQFGEAFGQGRNLFASFTSVPRKAKRANPYAYLVDLRAQFGQPMEL